jgi:hypothetical protein
VKRTERHASKPICRNRPRATRHWTGLFIPSIASSMAAHAMSANYWWQLIKGNVRAQRMPDTVVAKCIQHTVPNSYARVCLPPPPLACSPNPRAPVLSTDFLTSICSSTARAMHMFLHPESQLNCSEWHLQRNGLRPGDSWGTDGFSISGSEPDRYWQLID